MSDFFVSLTYLVVVAVSSLWEYSFKDSLTYVLSPISSCILWYFAYSRKRAISNVVMEIYRYRKGYFSSNKTIHCTIITLTIIQPALDIFLYVITHFTMDFETGLDFWAFGYKINNKLFFRLLLFYAKFADFAFCAGFIFYLTICICLLFRRCSDILSEYKKFFVFLLQKDRAKTDSSYLSDYFCVVKLLLKLSKTFSHISFLIIAHYLTSIFSSILIMSTDIMYLKENPFYFVTILYYTIRNIVAIVAFTVCSSLIPEHLIEIKTLVKCFLNCYPYNDHVSKRNLFYLKRIENQDIVHISACGLLYVSRSFILSAIGLMLTYGLIIFNL